MVMQYTLARDMIVQVLLGDSVTWWEVEALDNIGEDPAANEVMTDKTTYGDNGNYGGIKMQVGAALALTGKKAADSITGVQVPGQLRCSTLAAGVAYAGLGQVRWRDELETSWKVWTEATFSRGAGTGGNNDLRTFACTIGRNGTTTTVAV